MDSTEEILSQLELTAKKSVVNSSDIVKIINNYKLTQLRDIIDKISSLDNEISNNIVEEDKIHLFKFDNLFKILEEKYSDLIGKIYEIFNFAEKKKKENSILNNLNLSDTNNIKKSLYISLQGSVFHWFE